MRDFAAIISGKSYVTSRSGLFWGLRGFLCRYFWAQVYAIKLPGALPFSENSLA